MNHQLIPRLQLCHVADLFESSISLLNATLVVDPFGKRIEFSDWALSPDMHFVLLKR